MKFLLDQNLSPKTTLFLRELGIEAIDVREIGLAGKEDDEIYDYAVSNAYVLITFDHEFGYKYVSRRDLEGLIIMRLHPQTIEEIHGLLRRFFSTFNVHKVRNSIIVLERHRFRIRKMGNGK